MIKRILEAVALAGLVAGLVLFAAGVGLAQEPGEVELIKRDPGPPIPPQHRVLTPEQFGGAEVRGLSPQIRSILRQKSRRQLNPPAPHRDAVELGPPFHQKPEAIPQPAPACVPGPNQPCP